MIKYRVIKTNYKALEKLWEDNWQLICIDNDKMIFSKKVTSKSDRDKKQAIKTKEFIEFSNLYKTLKPNWLSSDSLIKKYNQLVEQWLHNKIMLNLNQYKKYIEVKRKQDYVLMASTYINKARYEDEWEIVEDMSKKWINDVFIEKWLTSDVIDNVLTEISAWETKNKPKELTNWVLENIIRYVLTWEL